MIDAGDAGMKLEMPVAIDMIERQPGRAKSFELRGDFFGDLPPHAKDRRRSARRKAAGRCGNRPLRRRPGREFRAGRLTGVPSTRTTCRPTRRFGSRRARSTASAAAGAADHQARRAQDAAPVRFLDGGVDRFAEAEIVRRDDQPDSVRELPPFAQEGEELDAFAQPALHHLRAAHHLADDRGDLRRAEVEAPVELLDRLENLGVAEMRIMQRRDLHAAVVDEFGMRFVEPAVLQRFAIKLGAGIGRRQRDLDGVRIDLGGEADGLLDGLPGSRRAARG